MQPCSALRQQSATVLAFESAATLGEGSGAGARGCAPPPPNIGLQPTAYSLRSVALRSGFRQRLRPSVRAGAGRLWGSRTAVARAGHPARRGGPGRWPAHTWGVEGPGLWWLGQRGAAAEAGVGGAGGACGWVARVTRGRPEQVLAPDAGEWGSVAGDRLGGPGAGEAQRSASTERSRSA